MRLASPLHEEQGLGCYSGADAHLPQQSRVAAAGHARPDGRGGDPSGVGGPGAPTEPTPAFLAACADTGPGGVAGATALVPVEAIPRGTVVELRAAAAADPDLVVASIEYRGMRDTRRLFTGGLVDQALARAFRLSGRAVVQG
ncbi:hypothetical protein [Streptomyces sp. SS8]